MNLGACFCDGNEGNCRFFEVNIGVYFCEGNEGNCRFFEENRGACFREGNEDKCRFLKLPEEHVSLRGTRETAVSLK